MNDQRFFCDHTSHTLHASPWINFVENKILDSQIYNLWQEDRLAAAVGAENRVPFLNPLVTNVVLSVPESMWPTMFFNKQILRRAFRNTLGPGLAERPKVPLYYGAREAYTAMMMLQLMAEDKYALLDYVFSFPNTCPQIQKNHLTQRKAHKYPEKA